MKKMLRFVLLLVVVFGIAAAAGMWKVRQLADSKLLIKEETIFTLEPGTGRVVLASNCMAIKSLIVHAYSSGCCASNLNFLISKRVPIASHRK